MISAFFFLLQIILLVWLLGHVPFVIVALAAISYVGPWWLLLTCIELMDEAMVFLKKIERGETR